MPGKSKIGGGLQTKSYAPFKMKMKSYGQGKSPFKKGASAPKEAGPKTERQTNMSKERALNKRGSELPAKDPVRTKMFNKADKLSEERYKRNKAGSPMKAKTDAAKRLLKVVPNQAAYDKLSDIEKKEFNKAAKKAKLPMKKSPAKTKEKSRKEKRANKRAAIPKTEKISAKKSKYERAGDEAVLSGKMRKATRKYKRADKLAEKEAKNWKNILRAVNNQTSPAKSKSKSYHASTPSSRLKKGVKRVLDPLGIYTGPRGKKIVKSVSKAVKDAVKGLKNVPKEALRTGPVVRSKAKKLKKSRAVLKRQARGKKSPAKAGQTAGQIVRRERHMN